MKSFSSFIRFGFWTALIAVAVVATLRIGYSELMTPDVAMTVSFVSPTDGGTTLMTSPDQQWPDGSVIAMPSLVGINAATFELPVGSGQVVRWDPGPAPGEYIVTDLEFEVENEVYSVDLSLAISSPTSRIDNQSLVENADSTLTLVSEDADPQLLIDVPMDANISASPMVGILTVLGAIGAISAAGALWRRGRWNEEYLAIALVGWVYSAFVFYVVRFASRLPFWDDWRYLREVDESGRIPISIKIVLKPFNDTVAAVGRTIDTLVLNSTEFNFFFLQLVGVVLLGAYIVLSVILVRLTARNVAPEATPYAILLVALALPAMSYWLEPAIAYHQFLPLLFGTGILLLLRNTTHPIARATAVVGLGLLAGFSYISGAVMLVAMAIAYALAFASWPLRIIDIRNHLPGTGLIAVAVFAITSQLYLIGRFQGSLTASSSVAASKYPWEPEFWAFYLGVAGRAVGLRSGPVLAHVAIVATFILAPLVAYSFLRRAREASRLRTDAFVLLFASVLAPLYMAAVSFGRAGMAQGTGFGDVVAAGGARFHYWWVAALIPLVWLTWVAFLRDYVRNEAQQFGVILLLLVTLAIAVPKSVAPWHFPSGFANRDLAFDRTETCLTSNILQGNQVIGCRHASSGDIGPQVRIAYRFDMVFIDQAGLPEAAIVPPGP